MIVAAIGAGCARGDAPGVQMPAPTNAWSQQTRVTGEYLVTLASPAEVKVISNLYGRFGIKSIKSIGPNLFLVSLTQDPGPTTMEELRKGDARIKAVQPNYVYRLQGSDSRR